MSSGERRPGDLRGGDDDIRGLGGPGDEVATAFERLFAELFGVAALIFRGQSAEVHIEELGTEGTHLLSGGGANVVCFHHGTQAARGGDGLQSRNPGADDEDPGRRNGSGSRHQHREEAG